MSKIGDLDITTPASLNRPLEIAGLGARAHAFIIDWHIRVLLALLWMLGAGLCLYGLPDAFVIVPGQYPAIPSLLLLPALGIYLLYHPVLETLMAGRTPGKRLAGVRLLTLEGRTPGVGAILLRNALRLIDSLPVCYLLGIVIVASTRNHVRIGDLAAGLVLVYEPASSSKRSAPTADLSRYSSLTSENLALLLELLERWSDLDADNRVQLARQFLMRVGRPVSSFDDKTLKQTLENLLIHKP